MNKYKVILQDEKGNTIEDPTGKDIISAGNLSNFLAKIFTELSLFSRDNSVIAQESDKETFPHRRLITPKESPLPSLIRKESGKVDLTAKEAPCPKTLQPFVDYWEEKGLLIRGRTTKSFAKDIKALKQLVVKHPYLHQGYNYEDWKVSVSRFALAVLDPNYKPGNKDRLKNHTIASFIYNPYNKTNNKSLFLHFLQNLPEPLVKLDPDAFPEVTYILKEFFLKHTSRNGDKLSVRENNLFIDGSRKLALFFRKNRNDIIGYDQHASQPYQQADLLIGAIKMEAMDLRTITPGWFRSERTFNVRLPKHLRDLGLAS